MKNKISLKTTKRARTRCRLLDMSFVEPKPLSGKIKNTAIYLPSLIKFFSPESSEMKLYNVSTHKFNPVPHLFEFPLIELISHPLHTPPIINIPITCWALAISINVRPLKLNLNKKNVSKNEVCSIFLVPKIKRLDMTHHQMLNKSPFNKIEETHLAYSVSKSMQNALMPKYSFTRNILNARAMNDKSLATKIFASYSDLSFHSNSLKLQIHSISDACGKNEHPGGPSTRKSPYPSTITILNSANFFLTPTNNQFVTKDYG